MSRIRPLRAALAAFGIVAVLLFMGAAPASAGHGDLSGLYGGALRVAVQGPISLNPFTATDANSWQAIPLVYDSLARIDPASLVPTPWAAASWTVDGPYLNVTLRSDLRFHDGTTLTAADIVYSYNEYKSRGMAPADLTVSGSGTSVSFRTVSGGGLLFGHGTTLPIVKSGTASSPVGSGPFSPPASVSMPLTLTANGAHFRPPYLETVTFKQYADLASASADLLNTTDRKVDFIGWALGVDDPGAIVNVGGVNKTLLADANVVNNPGLTQFVVGFNMRSGRATTTDALRLALAKTLNPILATQIHPNVIPSRGPIIEEDRPWYNTNLPLYQVQIIAFPRSTALLTESLQILDSAGYIDRDGDGIREKPDGTALSLTAVGIPVGESARIFTIQEASVDVFTRLGLSVTLVSEPGATILNRLAAGDYDIFFASLPSALDPAFLKDYFGTGGARNYFGVSDSGLDAYLNGANAALDMATRQSNVLSAQSWIMGEAFYLPLLHFNAIEATVRGEFDGWVNMPGGVNNFWTYMNLHAATLGSLSASLTIVPNTMRSGEEATAIARVVDQDGLAVAGVDVSLWLDGTQIASGTTDAAGTRSFSVTGPAVEGPTDFEITAQASALGYAGSTASASVTVHPALKALSVAVTASKVTAASGEDVTITATVTAGGTAQAGVTVSFEVIGIGGSVTTASGTTNAAGQATTTFSADVGPRSQFQIVATATAAGFMDGVGRTTVVVEQRVGEIAARDIPGLDMIGIIAAIVAIAVIAALAVWWGRRK